MDHADFKTLMNRGAGGASALAPIAVSDFKNNIYSMQGVSKTFADLWYDQSTVGGAHPVYKPVEIIPGIGMKGVSIDAVNKNFILNSQPALHALLADTAAGFTLVIDYSLHSLDAYGQAKVFAFVLSDPVSDPDYNSWTAAAALGIGTDETSDYFSVYADYYSYISDFSFLEEGIHRSAVTFHDDALSASTDGGEVISVDARTIDAIAGYSMTGLMFRPDAVNFGPQEGIIEKIVFYPKIEPIDLPSYSA